MYWPEVSYKDVQGGATFTVREGPNIVGLLGVVKIARSWNDRDPPNTREFLPA